MVVAGKNVSEVRSDTQRRAQGFWNPLTTMRTTTTKSYYSHSSGIGGRSLECCSKCRSTSSCVREAHGSGQEDSSAAVEFSGTEYSTVGQDRRLGCEDGMWGMPGGPDQSLPRHDVQPDPCLMNMYDQEECVNEHEPHWSSPVPLLSSIYLQAVPSLSRESLAPPVFPLVSLPIKVVVSNHCCSV